MKKLLALFLFPALLFADVSATFQPDPVAIGDTGSLVVSFREETVSLAQGPVYAGDNKELPVYEITRIETAEGRMSAEVVFFQSGKHELKIPYKLHGIKSEFVLTVNVSAAAGEKDQFADIEEPLVFSGSYIFRLVLLIAGVLLLAGLLLYGYLYYKNKKAPIDALVEEVVPVVYSGSATDLELLLQSERIDLKEFLFLLTAYIKETLTNSTSTDFRKLTDRETELYINQQYGLQESEMASFYVNPAEKKYGDLDGTIGRDDARQIVAYWRQVLK